MNPEYTNKWKTNYASAIKKLTQDEHEAVHAEASSLGSWLGMNEIVGLLYKKAGELYISKNDVEAEIHRDLANEIENMARTQNREHSQNYPKTIKE